MEASLEEEEPPIPTFAASIWLGEALKREEDRKASQADGISWRRLLRVPWTARRSKQSILNEISPKCSLEVLMLKLKLQYFGHLVRRVDSLEKTLMLVSNFLVRPASS